MSLFDMKSDSVYFVEDLQKTKQESLNIPQMIPYSTQPNAGGLPASLVLQSEYTSKRLQLIDNIQDVRLWEGKIWS